MNYNAIIESLIILLFPILIYFLYLSFDEMDEAKKKLFLKVALYSQVYLLIVLDIHVIKTYPVLFLSIPILIALYKKYYDSYLLLSSAVAISNMFYGFNMYSIILELGILLLLYKLSKNSKKETNLIIFVIIKCIFLFYNYYINTTGNLLMYTLIVLFYAPISYFIIGIIKAGDNVIDYKSTINKLQKEKDLQKSLFKVTHEIKNPIAVCKGYIEILEKTKELKDYKKYMPILKEEIDHTLLILDDFQTLSKIKIVKDILEVDVLLKDIVNSSKILLKENNIKLEYKGIDKELYLLGDYNRLKQVVINVLKNSQEALENKNNGKIKISLKEENNNLVMEIRDNGVGMNDEVLDKVKEAFFTTKKSGTGLGIYLSNEIIEGHDGTMEYESVEGKYTACKIILPLYKNF